MGWTTKPHMRAEGALLTASSRPAAQPGGAWGSPTGQSSKMPVGSSCRKSQRLAGVQQAGEPLWGPWRGGLHLGQTREPLRAEQSSNGLLLAASARSDGQTGGRGAAAPRGHPEQVSGAPGAASLTALPPPRPSGGSGRPAQLWD